MAAPVPTKAQENNNTQNIIDRETIQTHAIVKRLTKMPKEEFDKVEQNSATNRELEIELLSVEISKGKQLIKHLLKMYK